MRLAMPWVPCCVGHCTLDGDSRLTVLPYRGDVPRKTRSTKGRQGACITFLEWMTATLQNTMSPFHILYIKDRRRLDGALASIQFLRTHCVPRMIARDGHELRMAHEIKNMLLNAEMKLCSGLFREESRGTHFREDFPARNDEEWHCWVTVQDNDGVMTMGKHKLPEAWKPDPKNSYRENYPRIFPGEDEFLKNKGLDV